VSIADTDNFVPAERQSWLVSARYSCCQFISLYSNTYCPSPSTCSVYKVTTFLEPGNVWEFCQGREKGEKSGRSPGICV